MCSGRDSMLPWFAVSGVVAVEVCTVALTPTRERLASSAVMTALVLLIVAVIAARLRWRARRGTASFPAPGGATVEPKPDEPSERLVLALRLAELGVPASWIAEHCEIPVALAELVIAESGRADAR